MTYSPFTSTTVLLDGAPSSGDCDVPEHRRADSVHMSLMDGDRTTLSKHLSSAPDLETAIVSLQRQAEHGHCVHKVNGIEMELRIVAWPFLLNFGKSGGLVPAQFDMGPHTEPSGKRIAELWAALTPKAADVLVMPLRLGLHAHSAYAMAPDTVQRLALSIGAAVGAPGARVPRGLEPCELNRPHECGGPVLAPVLLQAAIFSPVGTSVSFVRDARALATAGQLIASKLSLSTVTPTVTALMPMPWYDALQATLHAENIAMATWDAGDDERMAVSFTYAAEGKRGFARSIKVAARAGRGIVAQELGFDAQWLSPKALRTSLAEVAALADDTGRRKWYRRQPSIWSDPLRLN